MTAHQLAYCRTCNARERVIQGGVCVVCGQDPTTRPTDCPCIDLIGPFEMDGVSDGKYQRRRLWWTVCRGCGKSASVPEPVSTTGH